MRDAHPNDRNHNAILQLSLTSRHHCSIELQKPLTFPRLDGNIHQLFWAVHVTFVSPSRVSFSITIVNTRMISFSSSPQYVYTSETTLHIVWMSKCQSGLHCKIIYENQWTACERSRHMWWWYILCVIWWYASLKYWNYDLLCPLRKTIWKIPINTHNLSPFWLHLFVFINSSSLYRQLHLHAFSTASFLRCARM